MLEDFEKEKKVTSENKRPSYFSSFKLKKLNFIVFPKITKSLIIILVTATCFAYLGYCLNNFISSPNLNIIKPKDNLVTENDHISIMGETNSEVQIFINGNSILTTPEGEFKKSINLKKGINNIRITAQKKYSQKNTVNKQILVK